MKFRKINFPVSAFAWIWLLALSIPALLISLSLTGHLHMAWLALPAIILAIVVIDTFQSKHAILKNYPLIGRLRYAFESIRPELRQYFFENELDGKPFNRRQRSIVYQRAKNEKQTISFGMQDDPGRPGYEWAAHSIYPKQADPQTLRISIGNSQCLQPYNASIFNIGAMSYGALSKTAITSLNQGAMKGGFAHNTGEGGISPYHLQGGDLVWQIGTGYFGCRDVDGNFSETLFASQASHPKVRMIEIKLSQGAKPGHGGLLPAHKNTEEIAAIRHILPFTTVHSPSAHTAFTNAGSFVQWLGRLKQLAAGKPVGFKLCIGKKQEFTDIVEQIRQQGIIPDFISIDGAEGGTGAAPLEFIDHMGMGLADALAFADATLRDHGLREEVKIIASGKIITSFDLARALALGADACYSSRGMMFALGCIQALQCDSGKCPVGIATQDKTLYKGIDVTDKSERVANFHRNTMLAFADFIGACGFSNPSEISKDTFFKRIDQNKSLSFNQLYPTFNTQTS
jgi:glutamate synthase domain-containing protein 2